MRPLALVLRAGAVVLVVGFLFSLLVNGAPAPVSARAEAAPKEDASDQTTKQKPTAVRQPAARKVPAGVVTIAATGDIVMGSTPNMPPDGGRSFFDGVRTDLAG